MAERVELHEELCELIGSRNVYFNPPESVKMKYDAIRYSLGGKNLTHASNKIYRKVNLYEGVVITRNPDTTLPDEILSHFDFLNTSRRRRHHRYIFRFCFGVI